LSAGSDERRRGRRVEARLDVGYEDRERQVFLSASDISERGVFLRDPEPPPEGAEARLVLALPSGALLRIHGYVVRQQREPQGFALRFDWDAGTAADRRVLREFIASAQQDESLE
jgi:hypothetical protein